MTDEMFPGQGRGEFQDHPGAAFAGEFADEPPLIDMVPRALAVYERGRLRRQVAGVGGGVAAVAATVLVATQLLGGGPGQATSATAPGGASTSGALAKPPTAAPRPSASSSATTPSSPATSGAAQPGPTCDQTLPLLDFPGDPVLPIPNAAAAHALCQLGVTTLSRLLPGHSWQPERMRTGANAYSYVADAFVPNGNHVPDGTEPPVLAVDITATPVFAASCANVWYPQTTCRNVTLADGTHGIEYDSAPSGNKPGGYTLVIDLPGGRQFAFAGAYQVGYEPPVTLDGFLNLVKSSGFADYVKQYKALMGV
jgi:hypothetical protein